jgi:hypothetical protein
VAKALRDSNNCASDDVSSNPHTESHFSFSTFGWLSYIFLSISFLVFSSVSVLKKISPKEFAEVQFLLRKISEKSRNLVLRNSQNQSKKIQKKFGWDPRRSIHNFLNNVRFQMDNVIYINRRSRIILCYLHTIYMANNTR